LHGLVICECGEASLVPSGEYLRTVVVVAVQN
jgi:hypothetical protein